MKVITTIISLFIGDIVFAQAPLVKQWDKRFGGIYGDWNYKFNQTSDGGYILYGTTISDSSGDKTQPSWGVQDYWVVKIDSVGTKQWDKRFGGTNTEDLHVVRQTPDEGYILGGVSNSTINGDKTEVSWGFGDCWLVKIDSLGNKQWDKDIGGFLDDAIYGLQLTSDGGYMLGVISNSGAGGDKTDTCRGGEDAWIIKVDAGGNKLWDKTYGGLATDYMYDLRKTSDGGYILGGTSQSGIGGDKSQANWGGDDYWVVKIDSNGNKQWDKDFGGTNNDRLISLQQTKEGGYILGGYSYSGISGDKTELSKGGFDYWVIKIDDTGNIEWDRDFGGAGDETWFGNVFQTLDNGYLLSGNSSSNISGDKTENNLGPQQSWIVKIDSKGNKQWDKTIFTSGRDPLGYAIQTTDGCYVISNYTSAGFGGYKTQPSQGDDDYWIIKFCDTTTTIISGIDNLTEDNVVIVFPNPTSTTWQLQVGNNFIGSEALVSDASGRVVFQQLITNLPAGQAGHQSPITFEAARGIYFLRISSATGSATRKLVRW